MSQSDVISVAAAYDPFARLYDVPVYLFKIHSLQKSVDSPLLVKLFDSRGV